MYMPLYRKKPVVIEAEQYMGSLHGMESWIESAFYNDDIFSETYDGETTYYIKTLEGDMKVNYGDYIIKGIQGELYPCKPDIFEATYDLEEK